MEVFGIFIICLLVYMGLLGLFGMVTGEYPIFKLWTGKPGRIASFFMFLPVLLSFLASILGWLGPDRDSSAYSNINVAALAGCVIFSLLAGWIAEKLPSPVSVQRAAGYFCARCGQYLLTDGQVMREQSLLVQVGLAEKARELELRTGYRCKSCGRLYCKQCLENASPNLSGGRACPACGGNFSYM